MNLTIRESIQNFIHARQNRFNADLVELATPSIEMQINVGHDGGEEIKKGMYSDGFETWSNFRIPHTANSTPTWKDWYPKIPLDLHVSEIGFSGWDFEMRVSKFVAADIDSIYGGHKEGLQPDELERLQGKLITHKWVQLRRSTGGLGFHVYVFTNNIPTKNHNEHAALAKCIFNKIGQDLDLKLNDAIDKAGYVVWFWSRKMSEEKRSYERLS
jgi:hypothetical protein